MSSIFLVGQSAPGPGFGCDKRKKATSAPSFLDLVRNIQRNADGSPSSPDVHPPTRHSSCTLLDPSRAHQR